MIRRNIQNDIDKLMWMHFAGDLFNVRMGDRVGVKEVYVGRAVYERADDVLFRNVHNAIVPLAISIDTHIEDEAL